MDWLWFTTIISSALAGFVAGHLIATRAHTKTLKMLKIGIEPWIDPEDRELIKRLVDHFDRVESEERKRQDRILSEARAQGLK
ncbi:MAG TPA: hypothetical protein VJ044_16045 [Candidatus Hodarchaeales archaeon]|nr:hypothetical protein [Candidatus Hodarchaeales archaeon]